MQIKRYNGNNLVNAMDGSVDDFMRIADLPSSWRDCVAEHLDLFGMALHYDITGHLVVLEY